MENDEVSSRKGPRKKLARQSQSQSQTATYGLASTYTLKRPFSFEVIINF